MDRLRLDLEAPRPRRSLKARLVDRIAASRRHSHAAIRAVVEVSLFAA